MRRLGHKYEGSVFIQQLSYHMAKSISTIFFQSFEARAGMKLSYKPQLSANASVFYVSYNHPRFHSFQAELWYSMPGLNNKFDRGMN